ncbi:response regulator transcription factor [Fictibacillus barbaricus]|uniref:Response regulator transcription factor n=1 Tax=Fictibacillus barbaricus TaxID=182136 RepID=A0ABS2ZBS2_9BACL|nr:response regulator transcription factor [Fictibacillus barbaricus]MBN3544114.1 response regulator transcription factor [Fictibacillus barbaricus]GGB69052.1 DNA-binding response regulator [Fictibacillus barbaricus]
METKPIKILVIEDDDDINELLCKIVLNSGYIPQPCFSGTEAKLYLEKEEWDLILLDLMLPGLTGEELLREVNEKSNSPVIIISALEEQQKKIEILRAGADDYITKPFDLEEVSARIDSHLRRYKRLATPKQTSELKYKDISINTESKEVTVNGRVLSLTAREYAILALLISSPQKIFTRTNLFESIWSEDYLGDENTVNVHMSNLRSKLSRANPDKEYIQTIWGMGYRLKN